MPDRAAAAAYVSRSMGALNIKELAEKADVDPGTVGDFLAGKQYPQRKNRAKLEDALGLPADAIDRVARGLAPDVTPAVDAAFVGTGAGGDQDVSNAEILAELRALRRDVDELKEQRHAGP